MIKHPTPQFRRDSYYSLNGIWSLNGSDILIPYPPESKQSCYAGYLSNTLEYVKVIHTKDFGYQDNLRTLIHFGAVDQIAKVYFNDILLVTHVGGYLPFVADATDFVRDGDNELRVVVYDDLDHHYPYGKQRTDHKGMWYTPVSGIWQEVWIEQVPMNAIESITVLSALDEITIEIPNVENATITIDLPNEEPMVVDYCGGKQSIIIKNPRLWSPDDPYLYQFTVTCGNDIVHSYFALRTISKQRVGEKEQVLLNGKPIFLNGVLDQGYFMDGIFVPSDLSEYEKDILRMKRLGFNMLRKHIKVEPECFYYDCDRLGMLVIQDMVNNGDYKFMRDTVLATAGLKLNDKVDAYDERQELFVEHSSNIIRHLRNHPSVVCYTIFNEGWGQFDSDNIYDKLKLLDDTRLFDSTSGWFWQKKSDFESYHIYFRSKKLKQNDKAMLLSEFGGYSLMVDGHCYATKKYGYGACKDKSDLTSRIIDIYEKMVKPGIQNGLCGCVYTQLSDIEDEINGFYTYDREVCKVEEDRILQMNKDVYETFQYYVNKT